MIDSSRLVERSLVLLRTARFMTLATTSPRGEPWASTVNYVCMPDPLALMWYSMRDARHSRNIEAGATVAGTIFRTDLGQASPLGLDGGQFMGECRVVESGQVRERHAEYYERNFPDEALRRQWMLPEDQFHGDGARRFYTLTISRWWLLDIDRWLQDMQDRRVEVPADALRAAWPG